MVFTHWDVVFHKQFILHFIYLIGRFLSSDWLKERAYFQLCPLKWLCPGHSQSELGACCVSRVKIASTHASMPSRAVIARQSRKLPAPFIVIIFNLEKSLSKWKILWNLAFFHSVYKTNIDCFLFGAQLKIIGPWWCQNHDYALSFASGIVMVLTSPRAYNFNCAPQSSQYLYTIASTHRKTEIKEMHCGKTLISLKCEHPL